MSNLLTFFFSSKDLLNPCEFLVIKLDDEFPAKIRCSPTWKRGYSNQILLDRIFVRKKHYFNSAKDI